MSDASPLSAFLKLRVAGRMHFRNLNADEKTRILFFILEESDNMDRFEIFVANWASFANKQGFF